MKLGGSHPLFRGVPRSGGVCISIFNFHFFFTFFSLFNLFSLHSVFGVHLACHHVVNLAFQHSLAQGT